jgi:toxin ParE1/3/4
MAEYRLSRAAINDLDSIWSYSAKRWGDDQADSYIEAITTAFSSLAQVPFIARACDHIRKGYRCFRVEQHIVYFRVTSYGIAIFRVLHSRMDPIRHL